LRYKRNAMPYRLISLRLLALTLVAGFALAGLPAFVVSALQPALAPLGLALNVPVAWAKKKSAAKVKKELEPLDKTLQKLRVKVQAHGLFSSDDAKALETLQSQFTQLMEDAPGQPLMMRPVYQLAVLLEKRERYLEAYEAYYFVGLHFNETMFGRLSRSRVSQLSKAHNDLPEAEFPAVSASTAATAKP
jgi:hypothetical protein